MKRQDFFYAVLLVSAFVLSAFVPASRLAWPGKSEPARWLNSARADDPPELISAKLQGPLASANIAVVKTDSADPVIRGDPFTYSITITNTEENSSTTGTIVMTDTLPSGVTFLSSTPGPTTCNYISGTHEVVCTLDPIAPQGYSSVSITVDTDGVLLGMISNTVQAINQDGDPIPGNNVDIETTQIIAGIDLSITKADNLDPVLAGNPLTYTLTVTNDGEVSAAAVNVTDTLPGMLTYVSSSTGCSYASGTVTCSLGSLAPGVQRQVSITATVSPSFIGVINNTAYVTSLTPDTYLSNNSAVQTTTVNAQANLGIVKTANPSPATAGTSLAYQITVTNTGPSNATGVTVVDNLPQNVSFTNYTSSFFTCTHTAGVVTCTSAGSLPVNSPRTININVQVSAAASGSLTNQAQVTATTPDLTPENNTNSLDTSVNASANLGITKTANPSPAVAGSSLTYQLTVTNAGPSNASGVMVTDTLPLGVSFISYTPDQFTCTHISGEVTCTLNDASLPVNTPRTVSITVQVPANASGSLTNQAEVNAESADPTPGNNTFSLITPVSVSADVGITKATNPLTAVAGSELTYQLTITNTGPSNASGVMVVDTLPAGVSFVDSTSASFTCVHTNGVVDCNLNEAFLPVSSPRTISITVRVAAWITTALTNNASVNTTTSDPAQGNNTVSLVTPVTTSADLWIDKAGIPAALAPGATLTYAIQVRNFGPSDARDVTVTDPLPAQVLYQSIDSSQGSCSGSVPPNISCNLGTLPLNATAAVTITVVVRDDTPLDTTISNTASVASTTADPNSGNNQYTETTTVSGRLADVQVTISDSPDPVAAGATLTYTILVDNLGPSAASNVILTETLPAGVTFLSSSPGSPTCTQSAGTVTCSLGAIAAGSNRTVTIQVEVPPGFIGGLETRASTTADEIDPFPANNTQILGTTQVVASADLSVDISDQPDPVIPGNNLQFQVLVSNQGPSNAANVRLAFTLPAGVTFLSSAPGAPACALQSGVLNCNLGAMNRQANLQVTVTVRVNPATMTSLNSSAAVTSDAGDPQAGNNTATESTIVTPFADLQVSITDSPDPVRNGAMLTYVLRVTNAGPSNALNLTLVNTLPQGLTNIQVDPGSPECTGPDSNRRITCTQASLASGASWQVTITGRVSSTASGTLTNAANITASTSDLALGNNNAQATTTIDTLPPTLSWVSPGPHGGYYRVGPLVHLEVVVSDDVGVDRVTFALWDKVSSWNLLYTDNTPPYSLDLDTRSIPSNWNEIGAVAYDKAGRVSGVYETNWVFIFVSRYIFMPFTTH